MFEHKLIALWAIIVIFLSVASPKWFLADFASASMLLSCCMLLLIVGDYLGTLLKVDDKQLFLTHPGEE